MSKRTREEGPGLPRASEPDTAAARVRSPAQAEPPTAHAPAQPEATVMPAPQAQPALRGVARAPFRVRLRPAIPTPALIPLAIALGMLAYISYVAVTQHSRTQILSIMAHTWLLVVLLIVPYLAARLLAWHALLVQLDIRVPWRELTVAFAAGEITKSLPAGVYLQNYLLGRLSHLGGLSVVRSAMATTAMLGLESFIAVPVALVVGLPGASWARWTLLGIVAAWVVLLSLAWLVVHYQARHLPAQAATWRQRLVEATAEFLAAGGELISPRTTRVLAPTILYMLIYALDLFAIIRAAGVSTITFVDTLGIYAILVLAVILVPLPTEIGITEFTGLGALLAYGLPGPTAALIMLSFRILTTGATLLIAGAALIVMRRELLATADAVSDGRDEAMPSRLER